MATVFAHAGRISSNITHAAIWSVLAFAALGDGDKAGELFSLLDPITHARTRAGVYRYKVEPYVADIYAESPHVGRGGWTWYTGSAGWMYRAGIEWMLRLRGPRLYLDPVYRAHGAALKSHFAIIHRATKSSFENPHNVARGVSSVEFDGAALAGSAPIPLAEDGATHHVRVVLGSERRPLALLAAIPV